MRERPIIFNADMVRAVLDGRKTQTRRIVKWRGLDEGLNLQFSGFRASKEPGGWVIESNSRTSSEWRCQPTPCPFGAVGDRLWVRESFYEHGSWQGGGYDPEDSYFVSDKQVLYPADGIQRPAERKREDFWRSRPSIHMPRWASRITLEITGVRVERLWDITEDDAKAEGCTFEALRFKPGTREVEEMGHTAVYQFSGLWQSIYGADSWQVNPWVWVIEFKTTTCHTKGSLISSTRSEP
ncbi:hypothetical protein [Pantoea eucalypti]|uniref:hypothetical protein n=1 Tax=Pantoea eucalypti TaxID=470933 RepID=UPI00289E818F|nr:hypothetical protein [Pantoea eucalypti]